MELENIVANTVLLKAREGKLTHKAVECKHYVGLAVSHFALTMQKRWGMLVPMTAVGSLRTARLTPAGKSRTDATDNAPLSSVINGVNPVK